ncbi:hypothetical protein [Methylobacterium sp. WSM2598]|uniref:hypothetical protein n=1 Tax=Methylobacterium sp. WSM2598 TaxID=398261 RepID=UPI00037E4609|nr:hypothetical protein [Methylobacterium sp. WSM2598]
MRSSSVFAAVTLLLAGPPAFAQGTAQQRAACTPDVWRLCASAIPNIGAITSCLRRESANLSPACRTVMNEVQAPTQQAAAPRPVARGPERQVAERQITRHRVAERRIAERQAAARPVQLRRMAQARPAPRLMTARPVPRMMTPRPAPTRLAMRRGYAHTAMMDRPVPRAASRRHVAGRGYGIPAGLAGLGGPGSRSAMRQANYWMRQIGGMMGGMGGGMGGMSLDSIRNMRVGDLMGMME